MSWSNPNNDISKQRNSIYIESLKGEENYELWSIRIKALLASMGLINYITIQNYDIELMIEGENLVAKNAESIKTTSLIKLNCYDEPLLQVQHITKSYEIWLALQNLYSFKGFSSKFLLCRELFNTSLESFDKMKIYLNQVKRLNDQLRAKDILLLDKIIFAWVLNNLSFEYETLITTITQSIRVNGFSALKLDSLFVNLIDEFKRLTSRNETSATLYIDKIDKKNKSSKSNQMGNHRVQKSKKLKCIHCKKFDHLIDKCWK